MRRYLWLVLVAVAATSLSANTQQRLFRRPLGSVPAAPVTGGCTPNVADLSSATVQAALNAASAGTFSSPTVVCLPSGTGTWSSAVNWTAPGNVVLMGQGSLTTTGGGNATIIVDNFNSTSSVFTVTTSGTGSFRMAGITFQGGGSATIHNAGAVFIAGTSKLFRLDHNTFTANGYAAGVNMGLTYFEGYLNGVVDHNICNPVGTGNCTQLHMSGYGGGSEGDEGWNTISSFGSPDVVVWEDNQETDTNDRFGTANDCTHAGRFVGRLNSMNQMQWQTHPTKGGSRERGCRTTELYGNNHIGFEGSPTNFNFFFLSAGGAMIWDNSAIGYENFTDLHAMRRDNSTYPATAAPNGFGYCGTSFNGTGSNIDENTSATTGYHCFDQPGMGKGDLLSGAFPNVTNSTRGTIWSSANWTPREVTGELWEWNNTYRCTGCDHNTFWSNDGNFVAATDYFLHTGTTSATSGVGRGTLSQRPATCVANQDYFFATDVGQWNTSTSNPEGIQRNGADGVFFKCSATNTWKLYYMPLQYPHPLQDTGAYATAFTITENPVSENGRWTEGLATGGSWSNVKMTPRLAFGTQTGSGGFNDSIAVLNGAFGATQTGVAQVRSVNKQTPASTIFEEVEILLRFSIASTNAHGYECNYGLQSSGGQYMQIVRWNGASGDFTLIGTADGSSTPAVPVINDGDYVRCSISGSTITSYVNEVPIVTATDATWATGNPGIGFYLQNGTSALGPDYGFTHFITKTQ